jgi:hypothetical protein
MQRILSNVSGSTTQMHRSEDKTAMNRRKVQLYTLRAICLFLLTCASFAQAQHPPEAFPQKIEQMQKAIARNKKQLHTYRWIETTTLTIKDKPRPPKQSICSYMPDGTLQKIPLEQQEGGTGRQGASFSLRGGVIRKLVAEKEKDHFQKEMKQMRALAKMYWPLNQQKLRDAQSAGQVNFDRDGTKSVIIIMHNYAKQGDEVKLTLNSSTMLAESVAVKSYFNKPKELFTAGVQFSTLSDGTVYPAITTMGAPSKKMSIAIVSSDFSKVFY